jgi:threonine dehydratase
MASAASLDRHLDEIKAAAVRIRRHVRRTPLLEPKTEPGLRIKPEAFQLTGSFKARGAFNAVMSLRERERDIVGVVTHSSGNHGQALACAARAVVLQATVVIPANVTPAKIDGIRAYGAAVVSDGVTFDNREQIAEEIAQSKRLRLIHPYDDWDIIHGAGTVGLEILEDLSAPAAVVVPIGGGGQISGIALAMAALSPSTLVIGVEPETAADAAASLKTRSLQHLSADPITIAEGVKCKEIGERNFEVIVSRALVNEIVTVTEAELIDAVRRCRLEWKLAVEATGALAVAAEIAGKLPLLDEKSPLALVLSGGNFDPAQLAQILALQ